MTPIYCALVGICGFLFGENLSGTIKVISEIRNDSVLELNMEPVRYVQQGRPCPPERISFKGTQVSSRFYA